MQHLIEEGNWNLVVVTLGWTLRRVWRRKKAWRRDRPRSCALPFAAPPNPIPAAPDSDPSFGSFLIRVVISVIAVLRFRLLPRISLLAPLHPHERTIAEWWRRKGGQDRVQLVHRRRKCNRVCSVCDLGERLLSLQLNVHICPMIRGGFMNGIIWFDDNIKLFNIGNI